jgi:hypothetical protein
MQLHSRSLLTPLEIQLAFSNFLLAAVSGPGALQGPAETGAGGYPGPARIHLAHWRIGYEDYLRLCTPLAVDYRL